MRGQLAHLWRFVACQLLYFAIQSLNPLVQVTPLPHTKEVKPR